MTKHLYGAEKTAHCDEAGRREEIIDALVIVIPELGVTVIKILTQTTGFLHLLNHRRQPAHPSLPIRVAKTRSKTLFL
ncbi:MAG: hypothetical protein WB679_03585 [Terracidiphilus sp.]